MGKSSVITQSVANPADQRVQVDSLGQGSQLVSPGATVANPGSLAGSVGSFSTLNQAFTNTTTGLPSEEVRQMMLDQETGAGETLKSVAQLSSKAMEASSAALNTLATAKTSEPTDWTRYVPYVVVGVIVIVLASGRRRAA